MTRFRLRKRTAKARDAFVDRDGSIDRSMIMTRRCVDARSIIVCSCARVATVLSPAPEVCDFKPGKRSKSATARPPAPVTMVCPSGRWRERARETCVP